LVARLTPNYTTVTSTAAAAFTLDFTLPTAGPLKLSWDDARQGVFGTANSFCDYRMSLDATNLGHRRLTVNGAANAITDWGTYTFSLPDVEAGEHQLSVVILPGGGATCFSGSGALGLSTVLVESY
jgi:hypothetical protein